MTRRVAIGAGVVLAAFVLLAQAGPTPSVEELLGRMEEANASLRSYEAVGDLTFEYFGFYATRIPFRIWASHHRLRVEYDSVDPVATYGVSFRTVILDVARGRQLTLTPAGSWMEEELPSGWAELGFLQGYDVGRVTFTSVEEEELDGRAVWVLHGHTEAGGWEGSVQAWVDQDSFLVRKTRTETPGIVVVQSLRELQFKVGIPDELFLTPPGVNVIVRAPRSLEAEAIMNRVRDRYAGLTSFYLRTTEGEAGRETVVETWYRDPVLRVESVSPFRIPSHSVIVWDYDRGAMYSFHDGRWTGTEFLVLPPAARASVAVSVGFRLMPGARYTAVEEDVVGDRPAWKITGEELSPLVEVRVFRWWVDRETYEVLQYAEPVTVVSGVRRTEVRTVRVVQFDAHAEVPPEKAAVPAGAPLSRFGTPGPLGPDVPGERAEQGVRWRPFSWEALAQAQGESRPVLLYFTSDWCGPCRAFEDGALHDARIVSAVEDLARFVVDLTDWGSPEVTRIRSGFRVGALPLLVALKPDGLEAGRTTGNVTASAVLDALRFVAPVR